MPGYQSGAASTPGAVSASGSRAKSVGWLVTPHSGIQIVLPARLGRLSLGGLLRLAAGTVPAAGSSLDLPAHLPRCQPAQAQRGRSCWLWQHIGGGWCRCPHWLRCWLWWQLGGRSGGAGLANVAGAPERRSLNPQPHKKNQRRGGRWLSFCRVVALVKVYPNNPVALILFG